MPDAGLRGPVEEGGSAIGNVSNTPGPGQLVYASIATKLHGPSDDFEGDAENMAVSEITDEDAQSLMELSISRAATRLKSANTPALEKAAAMDKLEGGGFFDSDPETPSTGEGSGTDSGTQSPIYEVDGPLLGTPVQAAKLSFPGKENVGLSLGKLPSSKIEDSAVPITPWHAGPKSMVIQQKDGAAQSSLAGIFTNSRSRSLSGGAEALKKLLPKGLPSMAQVGQMFGSSTGNLRERTSTTPPKRSPNFESGLSSLPNSPKPTQSQTFQAIISSRPQPEQIGTPTLTPKRPQILRKVTSDDSMLYHSLSRASSLGDDTRFENHHEQVNSRVKAIRDSLQDRSSFRMPQMPNLPSLPSMPRVPSFNFNMNFLNSSNVPARWRTDTNIVSDMLPGSIGKRKSEIPMSTTPDPVIVPGLVGAAVTRPQAATTVSRRNSDGSPTSHLDRAMEDLTGDIVIMGGYRGSILRSTKTNRQVWVPVKVGLNIRKVDLEVGLEPEDEERMTKTIYPSGMLQNIGPVDISKRLFKRLSECENARSGKLRVWDYGYDWRLSPHLLSRQLTEFLEKLPSNQQSSDGSVGGNGGALVIAHSLGGLITRHVVNHRPDLFSGVVYAGVPQACVNILGPLRNGDAVLLSSRVLTAQVNFTLRTSFVLLPEDGGCFIDINTKEKYPVDFFNIDDWIKYRWSPCTDPPLPPRNQLPSGGLGGLLNRPSSLLSLPISGKKSCISSEDDMAQSQTPPTKTTRAADAIRGGAEGGTDRTLGFELGGNATSNPVSRGRSTSTSVSTTVTIPRDKAITYLKRTLAETLKFKQELHFNPSLSKSNRYPPLALIYGKSIPTVYGAKVDGREGIPCSDSYDNLAFASGDGVCLAKEAMLPPGYKVVSGGRVSSDRGHVTLLGDLNAVGRAIEAVLKGRSRGIGLGTSL